MTFEYTATLLCGLLLVCGCSKSIPRSADAVLNTPSNRQEAVSLMQTVSRDAGTNALEPAAAEQFRSNMRGRLLTAGLSEQEVQDWIALGELPANGEDQ